MDYSLCWEVFSNQVLKRRTERVADAVERLHVSQGNKLPAFYYICLPGGQLGGPAAVHCQSRKHRQRLNIRYIMSNLPDKTAREIYFGVYVQRGEASENRINQAKNMCYADRLSKHGYWANFLWLLISCLAYELFLLLKQAIRKTRFEAAKTWQISTIRTRLLKVGATIRTTKRRIYYRLSKAFVHKRLFRELIGQ